VLQLTWTSAVIADTAREGIEVPVVHLPYRKPRTLADCSCWSGLPTFFPGMTTPQIEMTMEELDFVIVVLAGAEGVIVGRDRTKVVELARRLRQRRAGDQLASATAAATSSRQRQLPRR
jgi:hypothetical protein